MFYMLSPAPIAPIYSCWVYCLTSSLQFVFIGFMIGAVLFGIVADVYGRKKVRDDAHTASDTGVAWCIHSSHVFNTFHIRSPLW